MIPTIEQTNIINTDGNTIVQANAGTGKTYVLVKKIQHDIQKNHTHKSISAITFTIKAANEIKDRLGIIDYDHFIGTNNRFAVEEIIKPFFPDVFHGGCTDKLSVDYNKKVRTFSDGVAFIKKENIIPTYNNNFRNFIFDIAIYILRRSKIARLYLKSKYFKIFIDEYQDCDQQMHDLFIYISTILNIPLFIVGDVKQSIYTWRGANPELFNSILHMENFHKFKLTKNFRSNQQIVNYSNILYNDTINLFEPVDDLRSIFIICSSRNKWQEKLNGILSPSSRTALLRYKNNDAENNAEQLISFGFNFKFIPSPPIYEIATDYLWLYEEITKFCLNNKNNTYNLILNSPLDISSSTKSITTIKCTLQSIKNNINNKPALYAYIIKLFNIFGYKTNPQEISKFEQTITDQKYLDYFKQDQYSNICLTFHKSKGLEFDQVILFASDFPLNSDESFYNHYVSATRARKKLIIVYENYAEQSKLYAKNINKRLEMANLKMKDIASVIICK